MSGNTLGKVFQLTTFGESHGAVVGGVIDGVPSGLVVDLEQVQTALDRRKPGQSIITTDRKEEDKVVFLSGIIEDEGGKTVCTGTPIAFQIRNKDAKSEDYASLTKSFRPSHADYTYSGKYGIRDARGGGRSSARETVSRVVAGAIAQQLIKATDGIEISAYVDRVHEISTPFPPAFFDREIIDSNIVRCPSDEVASRMIGRIEEVKKAGDSVGGSIVLVARNMPLGLGEPVFDKLNAELAKALMSLPATKGIEIGSGFSGTLMKGSEHNDEFQANDRGEVSTTTNSSGGIQGGISNGEDLVIRIGFKPVSTIKKPQNTVDSDGNNIVLKMKGRHDPCVLPRAVPIVEAMVALVLADHTLRNRTTQI